MLTMMLTMCSANMFCIKAVSKNMALGVFIHISSVSSLTLKKPTTFSFEELKLNN